MQEEQRERERENPKQALHCQCGAGCRARTHELQEHDLSQSQMLNQLSHPGALGPLFLINVILFSPQ